MITLVAAFAAMIVGVLVLLFVPGQNNAAVIARLVAYVAVFLGITSVFMGMIAGFPA